jgi:predicted RNase H-like nuclease (RuvC/YqgF family)
MTPLFLESNQSCDKLLTCFFVRSEQQPTTEAPSAYRAFSGVASSLSMLSPRLQNVGSKLWEQKEKITTMMQNPAVTDTAFFEPTPDSPMQKRFAETQEQKSDHAVTELQARFAAQSRLIEDLEGRINDARTTIDAKRSYFEECVKLQQELTDTQDKQIKKLESEIEAQEQLLTQQQETISTLVKRQQELQARLRRQSEFELQSVNLLQHWNNRVCSKFLSDAINHISFAPLF